MHYKNIFGSLGCCFVWVLMKPVSFEKLHNRIVIVTIPVPLQESIGMMDDGEDYDDDTKVRTPKDI